MYKNNQLWNRYFLRSQRISYWYREIPRCPSIYIIDLNQFLSLFLLTLTKQKYFSSSSKLLFNYIVFEFTLLLVVQPRYSKNYIAMISCTWEWASNAHMLVWCCWLCLAWIYVFMCLFPCYMVRSLSSHAYILGSMFFYVYVLDFYMFTCMFLCLYV